MKVIDTFMFRDELDLLEFRLEYLYDHVDYFVIVESTVSHRGNPKTTFYSLYKDRFEKYKDKIVHVLSTDIPKVVTKSMTDKDTYIYREELQRSKILDGLSEIKLEYEDIILVSDIDEIPNPESFSKLPKLLSMSPVIFKQDWLVWNGTMKRKQKWIGTTAFYKTHLIQNPNEINTTRQFDIISYPSDYLTINSGWHLNWFGNTEDLLNKIFNTSERKRDVNFYHLKKSFRDLIINKRYPHINPTKIEYLEPVIPSTVPNTLPFFNVDKEPLIYDSVIYDGEEEALLIRLNELYLYVDYFVIFEGKYNKTKFLYPDIHNKVRAFEDKIIYIQLDDYSTMTGNVFEFETFMIKESLQHLKLKDNDYIYFSDIECIPSSDNFENNMYDFERYELEFVTLRMRWFYENFNQELTDNYYGTILTNWSKLKESSLSKFYSEKDESVHSIVFYRGWFLCNFYKHNYTLYDIDNVIPSKKDNFYPEYVNNEFLVKFV